MDTRRIRSRVIRTAVVAALAAIAVIAVGWHDRAVMIHAATAAVTETRPVLNRVVDEGRASYADAVRVVTPAVVTPAKAGVHPRPNPD